MYEATGRERKELTTYGYPQHQIDFLDIESEKVRRGIPVDLGVAFVVCQYQSRLQKIRKAQKRWWKFWE